MNEEGPETKISEIENYMGGMIVCKWGGTLSHSEVKICIKGRYQGWAGKLVFTGRGGEGVLICLAGRGTPFSPHGGAGQGGSLNLWGGAGTGDLFHKLTNFREQSSKPSSHIHKRTSHLIIGLCLLLILFTGWIRHYSVLQYCSMISFLFANIWLQVR